MTKDPQQLNVPQVHFLGEQDGLPERQLKTKLGELFARREGIQSAYLAIVNYGDAEVFNVALCLRKLGGDDETLVREVSAVFASFFGANQHLDIAFVSAEQETQLAKVCKPFFVHRRSRGDGPR